MILVATDLRGLEWESPTLLRIVLRVVARNYDGSPLEGYFRARNSATRRGRVSAEVGVSITTGDTTDLDVSLLCDVSAVSDGVWDLWLAGAGKDDLLRVHTNRPDSGYPESTFLCDGVRTIRPYDTADRQLSIHARSQNYDAVVLDSIHWDEGSLLIRAHAALGFSVRAGQVVWPDEARRVPADLRREANGEFLLVYDARQDDPATVRGFEWLVADESGAECWIPAGASVDNPKPVKHWLMPAIGGLGPEGDGWLAPELNPSGELVLRPAFPISATLSQLRARSFPRARAEALIRLSTRANVPSAASPGLADARELSLVLLHRETGDAVPVTTLDPVEEQRVSLQLEAATKGLDVADHDLYLAYRIGGWPALQAVEVHNPVERRRYPNFAACARPTLARDACWHAVYVDERSETLRYERRKRHSAEKAVTRAKNSLAQAAAWAANVLDHRPTWLVGENLGTVAQDNGVVFFEHCIGESKPERVLFVARTSNRHADRLQKNRVHVVRHNSFAHYYYYHRAERLVVAHGIRDVLPSLYHRRVNENEKSVVHLQHGIIALKKVHYGDRTYNGHLDAFVVSSEQEKELMVRFNGMSADRLIVTGLPRYDSLLPGKRTRNILVMPTWRNWIMDSEAVFRDSAFFRAFHALLTDEQLLAALAKAGARIRFYPHIEIENRYRAALDFASEQIEICSYAGTDAQSEIRDAMALVTDYSSVAWDVNYLRTDR
jgi:hypothetical protein